MSKVPNIKGAKYQRYKISNAANYEYLTQPRVCGFGDICWWQILKAGTWRGKGWILKTEERRIN